MRPVLASTVAPARSHRPWTTAHALSETLAVLRNIAADYRPAVLANAFGPESMVMTDLIAKHELDIEIFSIDTGRLPEETHALAHSVHQRYGPVIKMVSPDADEVARVDRRARPERLLRRRREPRTAAAASARSRRCAGS